jgi:hypothetical protein
LLAVDLAEGLPQQAGVAAVAVVVAIELVRGRLLMQGKY